MHNLCSEVQTLYQDWVDKQIMTPINLGNIDKLRLIDDGLLLQQLISELRIEFSNSKIPSISNSHIVCLLMLCCNAYEFNEATVKCYSNSIVCALWRIVSRVVTKLDLVHGIRSHRLDNLVCNRSVSSFENCHMVISSSSLIRTTVTSRSALDKRQLGISSYNLENVVLDFTAPPVFVCGPVVFVSYSFMILDRSGYKDGVTKRYSRSSRCECINLLKCFDLETREECNLLDITYLTIHVDARAMAFTRLKYLPPRLAAETCRRDISARRAKTHNTT